MISVATDIAKLVNLRWRLDRIPLLLYLLTFIVMSYPFVFQMHDHLPMDNIDTHTALWQNWWMREALSTEQNVVDSDLLFYPTGLDLTLQPRRWSTFPLWTLLYSMYSVTPLHLISRRCWASFSRHTGCICSGCIYSIPKSRPGYAVASTPFLRRRWLFHCSSRIPVRPSGFPGSCWRFPMGLPRFAKVFVAEH